MQAEEKKLRQEREKADTRAKEQDTVRKYLELYQKVDRDRKLKMESQKTVLQSGYRQQLEESKLQREMEMKIKKEERQVVDEYTKAYGEMEHNYMHSAKVGILPENESRNRQRE